MFTNENPTTGYFATDRGALSNPQEQQTDLTNSEFMQMLNNMVPNQ